MVRVLRVIRTTQGCCHNDKSAFSASKLKADSPLSTPLLPIHPVTAQDRNGVGSRRMKEYTEQLVGVRGHILVVVTSRIKPAIDLCAQQKCLRGIAVVLAPFLICEASAHASNLA